MHFRFREGFGGNCGELIGEGVFRRIAFFVPGVGSGSVLRRDDIQGGFVLRSRKSRSAPIRALLALAVMAGLVGVPAKADHKVTVYPGDLAGWSITTQGNGSGGFVTGPGTPPAGGVGSLQMQTPDAGDRVFASSNALAGTALTDITTLSYSTYRTSGAPALAPTLQLFVDLDGNGIYTFAEDDTLTFEPYLQSGTYAMVPGAGPVPAQCTDPCIIPGAWQTWDAAAGAWWSRKGGVPGPPLDTLANYATAHPGAAVVLAGETGVKLAAGSSGPTWTGFDGAVDAINIQDTLYDFEPVALALDCNTATDDIVAVQEAINAARDGDTISLSGVCDFTRALPHGGDTVSIESAAVVIRPETPVANLTIESDGELPATILGSGTQTAFYVAPGNDGVTIRGLQLVGFARPIVVQGTDRTTIGGGTATPDPAGNRIIGEAMDSAILALGNDRGARAEANVVVLSYGAMGQRSAAFATDGLLSNFRATGNYITYGAIDVPDGILRDVVGIDVRQKNAGNVDGVLINYNAVGFLTPNFPSFNINAIRVHAHSGDPNYHLRNVTIEYNNLGRLEELPNPVADVNAGGRAAIVIVRAQNFDVHANGLRSFQSPTVAPMPGGGIVVSDSSDGAVRGNGIITLADPSTLRWDLGAIGIVDDINSLFGSPAGGVGSSRIRVEGNIIGPVTNDTPGLGSQRGIVVNGSSLVDVVGNTVKFSSDASINIGVTVMGPTVGSELPRLVTSSLFCGNTLEGVVDDPSEVHIERLPSASSFPGAVSFPGNGECATAGLSFEPADGSIALDEGGASATYTVRPTVRPSADLTVTPAFDTQIGGSPSSLTFTPADWLTKQTVTISALEDLLVEGTVATALNHAISTTDASFPASAALPLTIGDNDAGTILLTESGAGTAVSEAGATDSFDVALTAPPAAPVTITFDAGTQLSANPAQVVFDATNFAVPQTVTVSAVDDADREGPHTGAITGTSSDPLFQPVPAVLATIADNDLPAAPVILFPTQNQILNSTSVTVSGLAEPGATVEVFEGGSLGTAVADGQGMWSLAITAAANATHTITAQQTGVDALTGPMSGPRTFSIDTIAPASPVITTPLTGSSFTVQSIAVGGSAEPNTTVLLNDNGGFKAAIPVDGTGAWSAMLPFTAGAHSIEARSRDEAGNVSGPSNVVSFTVALLTPTIIKPAEGAFTNSPLIVSGTADTTHESVYLYDFGVLKAVVPIVHSQPGVWSVRLSMPSGQHRLTAISRSAGGAASAVSAVRTFNVDAKAPSATVHRPQFYTVLGLVLDGTIRGTARDGELFDSGVVKVDLTYTDALGNVVAENTAVCSDCPGAFVHWSDQPDLLPGLYTVEARATDKTGNVSPAGTLLFLYL